MNTLKSISTVRPSPISGRWYSGDAYTLAKQIDNFLLAVKLPRLEGDVVGVVVPHAGYIYSGGVAAYAYAAIKSCAPDIVCVVSPLHQYTTFSLLTTAHKAYNTPFGDVPVAEDLIASLDKKIYSRIGEKLAAISYDQEHSLEIQLPFLQKIYPNGFRLLPIMVRDTTIETTKHVGIALAEVVEDKNCVLVASTDLSHFYPQHYAEKFDSVMIQMIKNLDPEGVIKAEDEGIGFACGRGALAVVLWASKRLGANRAEILKYSTSGEVTGDYSQVVGYVSAVLLKHT